MPFLGKTPKPVELSSFGTRAKDDFTANGSTTAFTLSKSVANANDIAVFVGNVRQEPTDAYTVNGTTLTMSEAPAVGLNFYVVHTAGTIESSVVPADNSISTAKIASGAVTGAKIENNPTIAGNLTVSGNTSASGTLTSTGLITASAGVAIGGTGAANTLDDYEEGTWTPQYTAAQGIGGLTLTRNLARYIKIGNQVTVMGWIQADASYTVTTHTYITNLPFDPYASTSGLLRQGMGVWGSDDPGTASSQSSGFGTIGMCRAGYQNNTLTLYHVTGTISDDEFIFACTYFVD